MIRQTIVEAYDPIWGSMYKSEESQIQRILGAECLQIHHIGSTAVPVVGFAQPTIDILVLVRSIDYMELYDEELMLLGYKAKGDDRSTCQRLYTKGVAMDTHHLYVMGYDDPQSTLPLRLKAYLNANPEEAGKYGEQKMKLAEQYQDHFNEYHHAKAVLLGTLIDQAIAWNSYISSDG